MLCHLPLNHMQALPKSASAANLTDTYHSHRNFHHDQKAILAQNSTFNACTDDWKVLQPIKSVRVRRKKSERGTKQDRNAEEPATQNAKSTHRQYQQQLSHRRYNKDELHWEKKPEWELQNEHECKLKHSAHRNIRQLWQQRNIPDADPVTLYNELMSSLHIKSAHGGLCRRNKQSKRPQTTDGARSADRFRYLKPNPIFSCLRITSSDSNNPHRVRKNQRIIIDIETRLRTHRPKVVLWPSDFYKLWNVDIGSYVPKRYDVELSAFECDIGSKQWRAVFTVNSHEFMHGIVPFTVSVQLLDQHCRNQARKSPYESMRPATASLVGSAGLNESTMEYVANMTTDSSYVVLQYPKKHKHKAVRRPKKRSKRKARKTKRKKQMVDYQDTPQAKKPKAASTNLLATEYEKLRGSIADLQHLLTGKTILSV